MKAAKSDYADMVFDDAFAEVLMVHQVRRRVRGESAPVLAITVPQIREEFKKRYSTGEDGEEKTKAAQVKAFQRALKRALGCKRYFAENEGSEGAKKTEWIWQKS